MPRVNVNDVHILVPVFCGSASPFWSPSGGGRARSCSWPVVSGGWPVLGCTGGHEGLRGRGHWHGLRGPVSHFLGGWGLDGDVTWDPLVLTLILYRCLLNSSLFLLLSLQKKKVKLIFNKTKTTGIFHRKFYCICTIKYSLDSFEYLRTRPPNLEVQLDYLEYKGMFNFENSL